MEKKSIDKLVLGSFLGFLVSIFVTDAMYLKYRKMTYSQVTRELRWLQAFFVYLALHMVKDWKYDPLNMLVRKASK